MSFLNDFQEELLSQTQIVFYIESRFENELIKLSHILNDVDANTENYFKNNSEIMKRLIKECDKKIDEISKSYTPDETIPKWLQNVDRQEPVGELIDYIIELFQEKGEVDLEAIKCEIKEANLRAEEEIYSFTDRELDDIITAAHAINNNAKNFDLVETEDMINVLRTTIRLINNDSSSNIYRQAFINIFSIFDAYVFELLKKHFNAFPDKLNDFFDNKNNEKVKVTMDEIIAFEDIDALKNGIVEKQFEGKYLKTIIGKLKNYKPEVFDNIEFGKLMEMISRRNIHLHNKGYVDKKYIEEYNIYSLHIGDYAFIDKNYLFIDVCNTLSQFVTNMNRVCETYE